MQISILKPGLLSTVQDNGRYQYLSQAVPVSGVMDSLSARIANMAVGNERDAAVIEFTYANAAFKAETDLLIAYSGDGAVLSLEIGDIPADRPVFIPAGMMVSLNNNSHGCRTYLAVAGGWNVPEVLGSRSTYLPAAIGGLQGRQLKMGDSLNSVNSLTSTAKNILNSLQGDGPNYTSWSLARSILLPADKNRIRVVPAHEFDWFEPESITHFFSDSYKLSMRSNRMGYHLDGEIIKRKVTDELLSTAVTPGTIQVTGNGNPVLLMADCQTTGGYPRIAQVAMVDLPLCAQLKPGDVIYFKKISRQEAELLYLEREKKLLDLAATITNRFK